MESCSVLTKVIVCITLVRFLNAYNYIDKYEVTKGKRVEQKLDDIATSIKDLEKEIATLKRINKKLLKRFSIGGKMSDVPMKELDKPETVLNLMTSPLERNTNIHTDATNNHCPQGFELSTHKSCYHVEAERVTWDKARVMCQAIGGDLLYIETSSEHQYIVEHLKNSKIYHHCDVWTSGTDAEHEGQWVWSLRHTQKPMTYSRWQPGEPNNGGGHEHCVWMDWYFGWNWNDAKCSRDTACFICKSPRYYG